MTQINPFTGAIIQSANVQPRQSAEKERQIRRLQNLGKNAALQGDRLEHQVESSDALHTIDDQNSQHPQGRRQPQSKPKPQDKDEGPEHVDLKA